MGIYLNQPQSTELKIIYNKRDAAKAKDPSKILKVNKNNIKFGKSKNLDTRYIMQGTKYLIRIGHIRHQLNSNSSIINGLFDNFLLR